MCEGIKVFLSPRMDLPRSNRLDNSLKIATEIEFTLITCMGSHSNTQA